MSRKFHVPAIKIHEKQDPALEKLWLENDDVKACYNMVAALIIMLFMTTVINYCIDPSLFTQDVEFLNWMLKNFYQMLILWSAVKGSSFLVFYTVQWYNHSPEATLSSVIRVYVLWFVAALVLPIPIVAYGDFSVVLRFAFMMEQSRILMKIHGFVAESTWMTTKEKGKKITVEHFVYYLFAPTLVFRTAYPRTEKVDMNRAMSYASQFLLVVILDFYSIAPFVRSFSEYGTGKMEVTTYIFKIFMGCLMGVLTLFSIWYGILHCWSSLWAEMLRFADRKFYDKWWLLGSYSKYYREWNVVVHDWLHNYVYREVIVLTSGNRSIGALATFLLSAVFHELIITLSLGFYYPVLFVMFAGLGVVIYFISLRFPHFDSSMGNIFLFFSVFLGWSFQIAFYSSEYYSRINCPQVNNFWVDKLFPRSWTCF